MLAELNAWTETEKAIFLAINLKGPALTLLGNLPSRSRTDYGTLTAALDSRFGNAHQTELNRTRLRNRRRKRDEGLPELAEDIERLVRLAYPDADPAMLEVLAKDQFIDALPGDDARLRIRQMRPPTMRTALEYALELESFELARKLSERPVRGTKVETSATWTKQKTESGSVPQGEELLQACLQLLQQCKVTEGDTRDRDRVGGRHNAKRRSQDSICWKCRQKGHLRRNCPQVASGGREVSQQEQGNEQ